MNQQQTAKAPEVTGGHRRSPSLGQKKNPPPKIEMIRLLMWVCSVPVQKMSVDWKGVPEWSHRVSLLLHLLHLLQLSGLNPGVFDL